MLNTYRHTSNPPRQNELQNVVRVKNWPTNTRPIGHHFLRLRRARRLTLKAAAAQMNLSIGTIFGTENGVTAPSWETFVTMAKFYNVSLDWLAGVE